MGIPVLLAFLAAALFGAATPLSKLLLGEANPFFLAGLLYLGAAAVLAPRLLLRRPAPEGNEDRVGLSAKLRSLNQRNRLLVLGSILAGGFLGPVFLLFGLRAAKSASVSLWLNLELVVTALLGQVFFKDRMSRASAGAAAGILAASVLLSFEGGSAGLGGGLLVALACLAWGLDNHCAALIDQLRPEESTFLKGAAAGTSNLLIGLGLGGGGGLGWTGMAGALTLGALSYGASIVLYVSAAQGLGASRAQLFFSSSPIFGILIALPLLGEGLSLVQLVAAGLMVAAYALLFSERHGHDHEHASQEHTHWHRHGEGHHEHAHGKLRGPERIFGHSHGHVHAALRHEHPHVSDIHHRHGHEG